MCWHSHFLLAIPPRLIEIICSGVFASTAVKAAFFIGAGLIGVSIALAVAVAVKPGGKHVVKLSGAAALFATVAGLVFAVAGVYGLAVATIVAALPLDIVRFVLLPKAVGEPGHLATVKVATVAGVVLLAALLAMAV